MAEWNDNEQSQVKALTLVMLGMNQALLNRWLCHLRVLHYHVMIRGYVRAGQFSRDLKDAQ
jgi:hypothetical protein